MEQETIIHEGREALSGGADSCQECAYLRAERAGIHMTHAGLNQTQADTLAAGERCAEHRAPEVEPVAATVPGDLKIAVVLWQKGVTQPGEYVGYPRTLEGPYRVGFDGSREVVAQKYRKWLFGEVKAKGKVFRKLEELLPVARTPEGLTLVCIEPAFGDVIASCLRWMERESISTAGKHG